MQSYAMKRRSGHEPRAVCIAACPQYPTHGLFGRPNSSRDICRQDATTRTKSSCRGQPKTVNIEVLSVEGKRSKNERTNVCRHWPEIASQTRIVLSREDVAMYAPVRDETPEGCGMRKETITFEQSEKKLKDISSLRESAETYVSGNHRANGRQCTLWRPAHAVHDVLVVTKRQLAFAGRERPNAHRLDISNKKMITAADKYASIKDEMST